MSRAIRYAFRFAIIVSVVAALLPLIATPAPDNGPYLSALSELTIAGSSAIAQTSCANTQCGSKGLKNCNNNPLTYCHKTVRTHGGQAGCATSAC